MSKDAQNQPGLLQSDLLRSKLIAIARALARVAACEDAMHEEGAEMERKPRAVPGNAPD
jgi:hypothetical protein